MIESTRLDAPLRTMDTALGRSARELETVFLAEMLKGAGLGGLEGPLSGGPGEAQFASFMRTEHARAMVDSGGIGLAEQIVQAMKRRMDGTIETG